jgi:hypothetical protein
MIIEPIDAATGSYEDTLASLDDAVDRWLTEALPEEMLTSWVESTFPEHLVVGVGNADASRLEFWTVPYAIGDDDVISFGEPADLAVIGATPDLVLPNSEVLMEPAEKVIAAAISRKSILQRRRRILIAAAQGLDAARNTGEAVPSAVGGGHIPSEGSPGSLTAPGDQRGGMLPSDSNTGLVGAGNITARNPKGWTTGTYWIDGEGNLSATPVRANLGGGNYLTGAQGDIKSLPGGETKSLSAKLREAMGETPAVISADAEAKALDDAAAAAIEVLRSIKEAKSGCGTCEHSRISTALDMLEDALIEAGMVEADGDDWAPSTGAYGDLGDMGGDLKDELAAYSALKASSPH